MAKRRRMKVFVPPQSLVFRNPVHAELWRGDRLVAVSDTVNGITDVGMNHLLDTEFGGDAQVTTWYLGLINNSPAPTLAAADTMASHAGWVESDDYDEATRVEWTEGAASARAITNASPMVFTIDTNVTIYGIFVTSVNTKLGTTGTLWATAAFSTPIPAVDNDVLRIIYTVSG